MTVQGRLETGLMSETLNLGDRLLLDAELLDAAFSSFEEFPVI